MSTPTVIRHRRLKDGDPFAYEKVLCTPEGRPIVWTIEVDETDPGYFWVTYLEATR